MFGFIGFILFLLLVFLLYIAILSFRRMEIFKRIKNKVLIWCLSLLPLVILFFVFNIVNSFIIILHYVFFLIIINIIMIIFKKKNNNILVIISVVVTAIYMGYAAYQNYHIYETKYNLITTKNIDNLKIIHMSDMHVGATFDGKGFKNHMKKLSSIDTDIIVITGDFIDDSTSKEDMIDACSGFSLLNPKYGIYFVNGNHDRSYYSNKYSYEEFRSELLKNNVTVLEDDIVDITDNIVLIGRKDRRFARKSIDELVKDIDSSKYIIDLNHQPNDYDNEEGKVDLVLSGHTHGGQLFPVTYFGDKITGDDLFYGLATRKNTNFIVTSGMSSWAIDFKTGTHSEYVVIDIVGEPNE